MISKAERDDLERICEIYHTAREFMSKSGNGTQWGTSYPPLTELEADISKQQLYVCVRDNIIRGVFVFFIGDDPIYTIIENGAWKNDAPYGVIHRVASDGSESGILAECLDYCKSKIGHLRIDTHENNSVMRHLLVKHGFEECGIVYMGDGSERRAYEFS